MKPHFSNEKETKRKCLEYSILVLWGKFNSINYDNFTIKFSFFQQTSEFGGNLIVILGENDVRKTKSEQNILKHFLFIKIMFFE